QNYLVFTRTCRKFLASLVRSRKFDILFDNVYFQDHSLGCIPAGAELFLTTSSSSSGNHFTGQATGNNINLRTSKIERHRNKQSKKMQFYQQQKIFESEQLKEILGNEMIRFLKENNRHNSWACLYLQVALYHLCWTTIGRVTVPYKTTTTGSLVPLGGVVGDPEQKNYAAGAHLLQNTAAALGVGSFNNDFWDDYLNYESQ
ncbi:unnamed protein product, partial [Amoebophrya sp. A120]